MSWAEWARASGAVIFITGSSTVVMGTLPLLNGLFAARLTLDWHQLGWLGTAAQCGTLVGTLLGYWAIERRSLRAGLQLGAACAVLAWLVGATAQSFSGLVIAAALGPLEVALFQGSNSASALLCMSVLLCCAALVPAIARLDCRPVGR